MCACACVSVGGAGVRYKYISSLHLWLALVITSWVFLLQVPLIYRGCSGREGLAEEHGVHWRGEELTEEHWRGRE